MTPDSKYTDTKGETWIIWHDRAPDGRFTARAAGPVPRAGAIGDVYRAEAETAPEAERLVIAKIEAKR